MFCGQCHEHYITVILNSISCNYYEDKIKTSSKNKFSSVTTITSKASSDDHHVMKTSTKVKNHHVMIIARSSNIFFFSEIV